MYVYTLLLQDGSYVVLDKCFKKWKYKQISKLVGGMIEYIPTDYFPEGMRGSVIGNEEGRFNPVNHRNPHMKVLYDPMGRAWDTVGDLLLEQTEKQFAKWQESRGEA